MAVLKDRTRLTGLLQQENPPPRSGASGFDLENCLSVLLPVVVDVLHVVVVLQKLDELFHVFDVGLVDFSRFS